MDLLTRNFTAQSVAMATGTTAKQITDWCNLGRIIGQREPIGRGHSRKFSWFNLMEVAIAAELMDSGFSQVQEAFAAAQHFAHSGEAPAHYLGDAITGPVRDPGLPWHHNLGLTYLLVWKGGSKVVLTDYEGAVKLSNITPAGHRVSGILAVNVSEVFARVCHRMALDYREVLDEAYHDDDKG